MSFSFTPYCTDEDIAIRACGDFGVLCPRWQSLATGTDGVFSVEDLWTLTSASATFAGVGVGNVVQLTGPRPQFTGSGAFLGVAAQSAGAVTLRLLGMAAGIGAPPVPSGGLTGVSFNVLTLQPQINAACLDVNNQLGIDPVAPLFQPAWIYDPNLQLDQFAVLTVLQRQYAMEVRAERGDFAVKLRQVECDLAAVKARTTVRWGVLGRQEAEVGVFSTQIRR